MTETDFQAQEPAIAENLEDEVQEAADAAPAVTDADESLDPKRKPGAEARISELTRLRRDAERDRDHWRDMATRAPQAKPAAEPEVPKKVPTLADSNYDEGEYAKALSDYYKTETARQVREDLRKEDAEKARKDRLDTFGKRESKFASKHEDYHEVTRDSSLPITQTVADLVQDSDIGPDVLYYLANNRDECEAIARMDERAAARAIGRIEAKLEKPAAAPPKPPVSKAPPPPPQIEAGDSAVRVSTTSPDSDKLSDDDWVKAERKRLARKVKANA